MGRVAMRQRTVPVSCPRGRSVNVFDVCSTKKQRPEAALGTGVSHALRMVDGCRLPASYDFLSAPLFFAYFGLLNCMSRFRMTAARRSDRCWDHCQGRQDIEQGDYAGPNGQEDDAEGSGNGN